MVLIQWCLTGLGLSKVHEFGDRSRAEMWVLSCLLFKVYLIKTNSSFSKFIRGYTEDHFDWHPQVRLAKKLAHKRAHAEAKQSWQDRHNWMVEYASEMEKKANKLGSENAALIRAIKLVEKSEAEQS